MVSDKAWKLSDLACYSKVISHRTTQREREEGGRGKKK